MIETELSPSQTLLVTLLSFSDTLPDGKPAGSLIGGRVAGHWSYREWDKTSREWRQNLNMSRPAIKHINNFRQTLPWFFPIHEAKSLTLILYKNDNRVEQNLNFVIFVIFILSSKWTSNKWIFSAKLNLKYGLLQRNLRIFFLSK